jgi:hypothetical protein
MEGKKDVWEKERKEGRKERKVGERSVRRKKGEEKEG